MRAIGMIAALLLAGAAPAPSHHVGTLTLGPGDHYVDATINGVVLKLRVDLDAHAMVHLNPAAARRAGFGTRILGGRSRWDTGPIVVWGRFAAAPVSIDGRALAMPVHWFPRDVAADADGVVSPALLPFEIVSLSYGPSVAPARRLRFGASFDRETGIHVSQMVGKHRVRFRFDPSDETVATTAATAVLAEAQGGTWGGARRPICLTMGVERPARPMVLERPLAVGELKVDRLLARLFDWAGKHRLPTQLNPAAAPDEILVVARSATQRPIYRVTLGQPTLKGCFEAAYQPLSHELTFTCSVDNR